MQCCDGRKARAQWSSCGSSMGQFRWNRGGVEARERVRALWCCRRLSMLGRRHQPQQFQVHLRTHWQQHAFSWQQIPMPAFRRRGPCRQHPQCKRLPAGPGKSRDSHSLFGSRRNGALALEARVCTRSTGIDVLHAWLSRERFSLFLTAAQRRLGARTAAPYCLPVSAPPLPLAPAAFAFCSPRLTEFLQF